MTPGHPRLLLAAGVAALGTLVLLLFAARTPEAPGPAGWLLRWGLPMTGALLAAAALAQWSGDRRARLLLAAAALPLLAHVAARMAA
ncbi:hypothetical protein [Deinococcus maricopensis]|uniref:Uncharacterized protein n=1 Tax=Deinococcus maricopensis (strain DSM 21211 / LMG 22137 / NRRL B-23946 / LB-34) TaxID=709986 RepID=E8UBU1_DEIML|nr:hypothetical protein [Deinococcus maricopensis]ADV68530.1 hypothetical protein Deima_2901 [Deinococcus maricopensis DSM 21211]